MVDAERGVRGPSGGERHRDDRGGRCDRGAHPSGGDCGGAAASAAVAEAASRVAMKRHTALVELSRDHQHALAVARVLRQADGATSRQAAAAFEAFWLAEARAHFRLEEEVLLPAYALYGDADHPSVVQVLVDHMLIRAAAKRVARGNISV